MFKAKDKKVVFADLALLLVALFWGGGFVAVKDAISSIPPFYMIAIRFGISSLVLSFIFWPKMKIIDKYEIKTGALVGIFLFLAFSAQTLGAQFTTAGKQAFLTGVNVAIVPFLTWILYDNEIDANSIVSSILCLIGIGFLTLKGGNGINIGDLLTLLSAVFFAIHITLLGQYARKSDAIILAIIQMVIVFKLPFQPYFTKLV